MSIRGTKDWYDKDYASINKIRQVFDQLCQKYDLQSISTSILEDKKTILRTSGEDSDICSKEMFQVSHMGDSEDSDMILRPEGTAPAIRALSEMNISMQAPLKIGYFDKMYRYCRPQKGRLREFHQAGVEFFGKHPLIDVESIAMAVNMLSELKVLEHVTLNINTIGSGETRHDYAKKLGIYFEQNKDKIAYLHQNPLRTLDKLTEAEKLTLHDMPKIIDMLSIHDKEYFEQVLSGLDQLNIKYQINHSIVRGLDYYSHIVFEFTTNSSTAQNAVLAGGRYDNLINQIDGKQDQSAIGWATGIERLLLLIEEFAPITPEPNNSVLVINLNCDSYALECVQTLRKLYSTTLYNTDNLSKGLKYANKMQFKHVIICGEDEMNTNTYTYRNFSTGEQEIIRDIEKFELL